MTKQGMAAPASGARRLAAFAVDYAAIAAYLALLTVVGIAVRTALRQSAPPTTASAKLRGHALSFLGLTLPVWLYFALTEASSQQATPGKRLLGLRVVTREGRRLSYGRSLLRTALKLAPWELAHTAIWHTPGQPFVSAPGAWNVAGYGASLAVAGWYLAALFLGDRRTPYDRAAGSSVVEAV
ncbi:MAG: RDD family protein [Chloroflexota bacterium]